MQRERPLGGAEMPYKEWLKLNKFHNTNVDYMYNNIVNMYHFKPCFCAKFAS